MRIADADGQVIFVNDELQEILHRDAAAFKKEQPAFNPATVLGGSIGVFYADPEGAVQRLKALRSRAHTELTLGGRRYDVITTPIMASDGTSKGTVGQWRDITDQRHAEQQLATVVSAATQGDLTQRMNVKGQTGFHEQLGLQLNQLLDSVAAPCTKFTLLSGSSPRPARKFTKPPKTCHPTLRCRPAISNKPLQRCKT